VIVFTPIVRLLPSTVRLATDPDIGTDGSTVLPPLNITEPVGVAFRWLMSPGSHECQSVTVTEIEADAFDASRAVYEPSIVFGPIPSGERSRAALRRGCNRSAHVSFRRALRIKSENSDNREFLDLHVGSS